MHNPRCSETAAEVKASSPIRTSLSEREGSMWGRLKRPSPRRMDDLFPWTFKAICKRLGIPVPNGLAPQTSSISHHTSSISLIDDCRSDDSELCHEMLSTFGFSQEQMHRVAERFHLGRSRSGKTIYWMIDDIGRTLDGRIGDAWVSTMLKARYPTAAPYVHFDHCLFGLHQISECEQKPIGIVESARSAVLLSELCPELIWLAYIYGCNLNVNSFEPLQGRKITLFPRTDSVKETYCSFLELADQVKRCYKDIDISVSRFLEDNANDDQKRREIDLLQYLLE